MFQYQTTVRLYQVDAVNTIFYGRLFELLQDAFEAFLAAQNRRVADFLQESSCLFPIVHCEAEFQIPLKAGDAVTITLNLEKTGQSSTVIQYLIKNQDDQVAATAKTVHVAVDPSTWERIPLPEDLLQLLSKLK